MRGARARRTRATPLPRALPHAEDGRETMSGRGGFERPVVETVAAHVMAATEKPNGIPFTDPRETIVDLLDDPAQQAELDMALQAASGVATDALTAEAFPLGPVLRGRVAELREQVVDGPGLAILRLPIEWIARAGEDTSTRVFVGLCSHLGRMIEQSKDLMETVARVEIPTNETVIASPNTVRRGYRNQKEQRVHVDASIPAPRGRGETDILAMMCMRTAPDGGGASKLTSAEALWAALSGHPQHLRRLAAGFHYDAGVEWLPAWRQPQRSTAPVPLLWRDSKGRACVQFGVNMRKNIEAAYSGADIGQVAGGRQLAKHLKHAPEATTTAPLDQVGVDALDALDEAANSSACMHQLQLTPGCALILDNYRWMHGRTAFSDDGPALAPAPAAAASAPAGELESSAQAGEAECRGRLLIRLWLQTDDMRT